MFCLAREQQRGEGGGGGRGSLDRVSNRGPISGDPSNGPRSDLKRGGRRSDRLRFQGWPRQNGLSYAPPLIPRTPPSIDLRELYLYSVLV